RIDAVERAAFEVRGEARPSSRAPAAALGAHVAAPQARTVAPGAQSAEPGARADDVLRFVSTGRRRPRHEMPIADPNGEPVAARREGQIQFRGVSAMQGYYRNPAATAAARDGEWYRTGDLGYFADGDLFVTGRHKDLIIRAGRNAHPQELERLAADV